LNLVKIRIAISLLVFTLFLLLFLGGGKISVFLSPILLPLQFVPALMRILTQPEILFIISLTTILIISLIFGRVYCSFLCPLGMLQDIISALSRKSGLLRPYTFRKPHNLLRYSILGLTIATLGIGFLSLVNLLDPYSITGRIITELGQPLLTWIYNASANLLKYLNVYLFPKETPYLPLWALSVAFCFLILILIMSHRTGRLYCNTLCPVGSFLGLLSRISIFQLSIDQNKCRECVRCEIVCKAGCIDPQKKNIDQSRCVNCFNCLEACPQSLIIYSPSFNKIKNDEWSPARRGFLIAAFAASGSFFLAFNSGTAGLRKIAHANDRLPITPPGSVSFAHFTCACIACNLCVSACPTNVITPSFLEYGITGLMQPLMNYQKSFCDYECNICGKVCPTGAILPLPLEEKKLTQIGEVKLIKEKCIVYVDKQNCGACGEVCPTHTINFTNKSNVLYPETDTRYCIGCGACEKACPTSPKSIVVRSNSIHKKAVQYIAAAKLPQPKKETSNDFPF